MHRSHSEWQRSNITSESTSYFYNTAPRIYVKPARTSWISFWKEKQISFGTHLRSVIRLARAVIELPLVQLENVVSYKSQTYTYHLGQPHSLILPNNAISRSTIIAVRSIFPEKQHGFYVSVQYHFPTIFGVFINKWVNEWFIKLWLAMLTPYEESVQHVIGLNRLLVGSNRILISKLTPVHNKAGSPLLRPRSKLPLIDCNKFHLRVCINHNTTWRVFLQICTLPLRDYLHAFATVLQSFRDQVRFGPASCSISSWLLLEVK